MFSRLEVSQVEVVEREFFLLDTIRVEFVASLFYFAYHPFSDFLELSS